MLSSVLFWVLQVRTRLPIEFPVGMMETMEMMEMMEMMETMEMMDG